MKPTKDQGSVVIDSIVNTRINKGTRAQLEAIAQREERSLSFIVRRACEEYVYAHGE